MSEQKEKNKLYLELKELDERIKRLYTQMEKIDEQLTELNSSKIIVNKFLELKIGDELRIPLTSGVYINTKLNDTKKLLVNVGAGVSVEKMPQQVLEILDSQLTELVNYREQLIVQMQPLIKRVEEIQMKVEA